MAGSSSFSSLVVPSLPPLRPKSLPEYLDLYGKRRELPKVQILEREITSLEPDAHGYPVAVMPLAKGLVLENHPHFIGTYWGAVSTTFCAEIVESADAYLFTGPIFKREKAIIVQPECVVIENGPAFGCVTMKDFLRALAKQLKRNTTVFVV